MSAPVPVIVKPVRASIQEWRGELVACHGDYCRVQPAGKRGWSAVPVDLPSAIGWVVRARGVLVPVSERVQARGRAN